MHVVAGGIKLNNFENEEEPRNIDQIIGHPNYASATITNDACLLKLKESLEWTDFVKPIALPAAGQDTPAGTECTVTGWGTLNVRIVLKIHCFIILPSRREGLACLMFCTR